MRITKTQRTLNRRLANTLRRSYPIVGSAEMQASYNRLTDGNNPGNNLTQPAWIEALPKYQPFPNGFKGVRDLLEKYGKASFVDFLEQMFLMRRGDIFPPFTHQAASLEAWASGKDFVVSTGTGSGKTECFLWPMLGHLHEIAQRQKELLIETPGEQKSLRGVKTIVLYPMNALVGDQLKRLRTMLGDYELAKALSDKALHQGGKERFFQFGSYTGRTRFSGPYAYQGSGKNPKGRQHHQVNKNGPSRNYANKFFEIEENGKTGPAAGQNSLYLRMMKKGLIPAKGKPKTTGGGDEYWSMDEFLSDEEHPFPLITKHTDRELLFRHEMHNVGYSHMKKGKGGSVIIDDTINGGGTPDVLITNYSMLEYMLKRPLEHIIFAETRDWLKQEGNKIQLVLDEAHLYQGALGTEIGMLLKRLRMTLGIGDKEDKIQFILTSASLGGSVDKKKVFVQGLTGRKDEWFNDDMTDFVEGVEWEIDSKPINEFKPHEWLKAFESIDVNASDGQIYQAAQILEGSPKSLEQKDWFEFLYAHELYKVLYESLKNEACSINALSKNLFEDDSVDAVNCTEIILNFVASLKGITNIENNPGPLLGIRAHLMYKGLGELYWNLNTDEIQDTSSANIMSNSIEAIYPIYSCRRCGGAYAQVFIESISENEGESPAERLVARSVVEDRTYSSPFPNTTQFEVYICDIWDAGKRTSIKILESKEIEFSTRVPDLFISTKLMRFLSYSAYQEIEVERFETDYSSFKPAFIARKDHGDIVEMKEVDSECQGRYTFSKDKCLQCKTNHSSRKSDQITSLMTRGDQAFSSLTLGLHEAQDPDDEVKTPNKGKKVLIFSDGRQRAARLAKTLQDFANNDELRLTILHLLNDRWYKIASKQFSSQSLDQLYSFYVTHITAAMQDPFEESATYWSPREIFARNRQNILTTHLAQISNMKWVDEVEMPQLKNYPLLDGIISEMENFETVTLTNKAYSDKFTRPVSTTDFEQLKALWERSSKAGPYPYLRHVYSRILIKHLIRPIASEGEEEFGIILQHIKHKWNSGDTSLPSFTTVEMSALFSESHVGRDKGEMEALVRRWDVIREYAVASDENIRGFFQIDSEKKFIKAAAGCKSQLKDTEFTLRWVLESMSLVSAFDKLEQLGNQLLQKEYNSLSDLSQIALQLKGIELEFLEDTTFFRSNSSKIGDIFRKSIRSLSEGGAAPEFFFSQLIDYISSRDFSLEDLGLGRVKIIDKKFDALIAELTDSHAFELELLQGENKKLMRYIFEAVARLPIIAQQSWKLSNTGKNSSRGISSRNENPFGYYAARKHPSEYVLKKSADKWGTPASAFTVYLRDNLNILTDEKFSELKLSEGDLSRFVHESLFNDVDGGRKTTKASMLEIELTVEDENILMCTRCGTTLAHSLDIFLRKCNKCGSSETDDIVPYSRENQLIDLRVDGPWRGPAQSVLKTSDDEMGVTLIRAEEHTAQINDPTSLDDMYSHAERFEMLFQDIPLVTPNGDNPFSPPEAPIDILSCTTTMEVGIDIGSLTAVALRTVPREKANYQQRVGRAGRGKSEVCVALSWYDNRPYAQHYFINPQEIIHHPDNSPIIYLENSVIIQRHIWAAIMQRFFKRLKFDRTVRMFRGMDLNQQKASLMDSMGTKDDFIHLPGHENLYSLDALNKWIEDDDSDITQEVVDGVTEDLRHYSWADSCAEIVELLPEKAWQWIALDEGTPPTSNDDVINLWKSELLGRFQTLVTAKTGDE
jgi:Lhr-like helicase